MERIPFSTLPILAQVGVGLSLIGAWVLVEEFVIDRYGIGPYLPLYRVADVCVWDIAVVVGVLATLLILNRRGG